MMGLLHHRPLAFLFVKHKYVQIEKVTERVKVFVPYVYFTFCMNCATNIVRTPPSEA